MADWNLTDSQNNLTAVAVPSLPALGPWEPPAERGPSLESIYRVSLTVYFSTASWRHLKKKKNPGALGTCPVCLLVKTALPYWPKSAARIDGGFRDFANPMQSISSHAAKADDNRRCAGTAYNFHLPVSYTPPIPLQKA